mmetsp:Transcript_266/g.797  ORF Transcript_266/g.797 Transcript_266/m.797 type:complete len:207 (+) Transcript_266:1052-1672(+)
MVRIDRTVGETAGVEFVRAADVEADGGGRAVPGEAEGRAHGASGGEGLGPGHLGYPRHLAHHAPPARAPVGDVHRRAIHAEKPWVPAAALLAARVAPHVGDPLPRAVREHEGPHDLLHAVTQAGASAPELHAPPGEHRVRDSGRGPGPRAGAGRRGRECLRAGASFRAHRSMLLGRCGRGQRREEPDCPARCASPHDHRRAMGAWK